MGNSKSVVIDISQDVGTKELERLWREFAGDSRSMAPKQAQKFLKAFAKVLTFPRADFRSNIIIYVN
jgi:hypothetical protein